MQLINPIGVPPSQPEHIKLSIDSLDGAVVGLLWNGYRNADVFLRRLELRIRENFGPAECLWFKKPYVTESAPTRLLDEVVAQCDVVFAAWGH